MTDVDTNQIPQQSPLEGTYNSAEYLASFNEEAAKSDVGTIFVENNFARFKPTQTEITERSSTSAEGIYDYVGYVRGVKNVTSEIINLRNEAGVAHKTETSGSVIGKIISKIAPGVKKSFLSKEHFVKMESEIGGQLFGPVPDGHMREFSCEDEQTWVWRESTINPQDAQRTSVITRYQVQGDKIIKMQDGQPHHYTSSEETRNLLAAAQQYYSKVATEVYGKQIA